MNKTLLACGTALLGAALLAAWRPTTPEGLDVGTQAPEISSAAWFNHIGRPLTLANLRGQAVLIEFWATW